MSNCDQNPVSYPLKQPFTCDECWSEFARSRCSCQSVCAFPGTCLCPDPFHSRSECHDFQMMEDYEDQCIREELPYEYSLGYSDALDRLEKAVRTHLVRENDHNIMTLLGRLILDIEDLRTQLYLDEHGEGEDHVE